MASEITPTKLRIITYLCPSLPVEYFEAIAHYLENKLNLPTSLIYESRWEGPPDGRPDPFAENDVDIAFMSSASFLRLADSKNEHSTLLPVTSVHQHPRGEGKPGYFSDIIVHTNLKDKIKEFLDLRGCKWAFSRTTSLSSYLIVRQHLKVMGENPSFFGNLLPSGSHINSIKMVLQKQADAAAVDSNCLAHYLKTHPEVEESIFILESWGPHPPYPIVVNKNLSKNFQSKLTDALLAMPQDVTWKKLLEDFGVTKFVRQDRFTYDTEREIIKTFKGLTLDAVYY